MHCGRAVEHARSPLIGGAHISVHATTWTVAEWHYTHGRAHPNQ
jgi:hypothetical protein